jgi:hypothetical protein
MSKKPDLTDFQKNFLLGQGAGQTLYTEKEFEERLAQAKAEIMAIAIQTSKQAIQIERRACAELVMSLANEEDEGEVSTALKNAAMAVLRRIPGQFDGE